MDRMGEPRPSANQWMMYRFVMALAAIVYTLVVLGELYGR